MAAANASNGPSPLDRLIGDIDWAHLKVMIGPSQGCPTVPELFTTLRHGAAPVRSRALYDLSEAINHQNSIAEATAPALITVAALLTDPDTDRVTLPTIPHWTDSPIPLRAGLLLLMASVLNDVGNETEAATLRHGFTLSREALQVRAIRPALIPSVLLLLDDLDVQVREAAALALLPLAQDPSLTSQREALNERASAILASSADPHRRRFAARVRAEPADPAAAADKGCCDDPLF
ncbi:hypothetical protein [Actinomadura gamaensis]|uniref:HEAT repeat protein n=1 Tax=Actinomadura gamaensis TaxID=1763541 RepID=A0ABV9U3R2_9ACTN